MAIRETVWITKRALSSGIVEAEVDSWYDKTTVIVLSKTGLNGRDMYFMNDFVRTKPEAIARAKTMRDKKIRSLKKQIERLEELYSGDAE